ncbi:MAG: cell division protein FtsZ [Erysipelotrichaceae bacterium]|nr:cell division protein FtsZ [Erysipelotrichaceae bacterium]
MSELTFNNVTRIKVFGVGGAGCNAVNRMVEDGVAGVDFYVCNTDLQVIRTSKVENKILLGANVTHGLGCGGNPEIGKQAVLENESEIRECMKDTDMVFITAGMGGGTGTGAAPFIAKCAKEAGALTIGVVTKPFAFEGRRRMMQALDGLDELRKHVDSIIVIPNNKVKEILGDIPFRDSFKEADNILRQAVQTITDLVSFQAIINLDFADIKSVMLNQGTALIGIGMDDGADRAVESARKAINSPLLEADISGARNAIINITGGNDLTINDAQAAVDYIRTAAGGDIDAIFGVAYNENLTNTIIVTVIATGFENEPEPGKEAIKAQPQAKKEQAQSQSVDTPFNTGDVSPDFFNRRR